LSESLTEYYSTKPASKSHVPRGIRERLKYEITSLADIHRGTRTADLNGAFIERDHSSYSAGDWYQADDCTLPIYYYEPDGQGWYHLMRGQCLVMIDVRSTRILNFTLISERNYNSIAIRGLMARACDEHGLPRRGFDFECGIWKNAKLIKGNSPHDVEISSSDVEKGFGDLGLEFRHRYFPRTKPVEGVLGAIQNLMEGEPGYCGRDERKDKFQRMEEYARLVRSKKAEPKLYFYSAEQWLARISKICENYNSEVQNGKRLPNLSPEQGFENFRNAADPQTKLDGACSYLLATHRRPVRVTKNGIRLALPGKRIFTYRNQDTGRLIGQNVLAWFNPERADIITITDLNRQNAFAIARSQAVPAYDAPPEMLSREMALAAGHNSYAKTYYRELKAKFAPKFRRNLVDPDVQHLGVEVRKNEAALNTRITEERQTVSKSQKAARRLGITLTDDAARSNGTAESATRLKDLLDRIDEPETSL
jgi:hypothetical protein